MPAPGGGIAGIRRTGIAVVAAEGRSCLAGPTAAPVVHGAGVPVAARRGVVRVDAAGERGAGVGGARVPVVAAERRAGRAETVRAGVRTVSAIVSEIASADPVRVELIGVGSCRTVVASGPDAVPVAIDLERVRGRYAVVAEIAPAVAVRIVLIRVCGREAVVTGVSGA